MYLKITIYFLTVLFLFIACEEQGDTTPDNMITSEEYEEGVFYAKYDNGIDIEIKTNNPASFSTVPNRNTIDISEMGTAKGDYQPNLYWVKINWENGTEDLLPIIVSNYPQQAEETIHALSEMETDPEGYIIVFRHANADVGEDIGDASGIDEWWKSCDPQLARQIGELGIKRSEYIGEAIKKMNIPISLGISSEFCRARQTLETLELDFPVQIDGRLNHRNHNISPNPAYDDLEDIILENPQENGILIVVGHSNLEDNNPYLDYISPFNMYDGFLMKREEDQVKFVGYLPFEYWYLF